MNLKNAKSFKENYEENYIDSDDDIQNSEVKTFYKVTGAGIAHENILKTMFHKILNYFYS